MPFPFDIDSFDIAMIDATAVCLSLVGVSADHFFHDKFIDASHMQGG